jgi:hypothetical protein
MANLPFNHDRRSYEVKVRREGDKTVAEIFTIDGFSTTFRLDATDEVLADMKAQGHDDPLRRLQEDARDAFIRRT